MEFFSFDLDDDLKTSMIRPKFPDPVQEPDRGRLARKAKESGRKGQKRVPETAGTANPKLGRPSKKGISSAKPPSENSKALNENRKTSKRINKGILETTYYTFLIMFMLLIGYLVYF